jgi:RNA polymerase sigma-70 factor (ECF subfamily)
VTEQELIYRIKTDPKEFSILFEEYYKPVFGYVFRRTADFDLSRDIVSETFRKAFLNIRFFSWRGISLKVWIYRIATNEMNLYFRFKKIEDRYIEKFDFINPQKFDQYIEEDRSNYQNELLKHGQYQVVVKHLKTLPVKYQEVISLRYFESKSNREISEILDKKEGTVKSLISRGLEILREKCNEI